MANFPYTISGTKTAQQDGSTVFNLTIKDSTNVVISTVATRYAPVMNGENVPISKVIDLLKMQIRNAIEANFTMSDLPNNFSFSFNPIDLL